MRVPVYIGYNVTGTLRWTPLGPCRPCSSLFLWCRPHRRLRHLRRFIALSRHVRSRGEEQWSISCCRLLVRLVVSVANVFAMVDCTMKGCTALPACSCAQPYCWRQVSDSGSSFGTTGPALAFTANANVTVMPNAAFPLELKGEDAADSGVFASRATWTLCSK